MKIKLTPGERLKDLRNEAGLSLEELALIVGASTSLISDCESKENKAIPGFLLNNLADYFNVSTDYLLCRTEMRQPANYDISKLNLDDKTIEILKSGQLNNRLICELIKDDNFKNFLIDMELIVDGLGDLGLQITDIYMNMMREKILINNDDSGSDNADEKFKRLFENFKIKDTEYFMSVLTDDLEKIISNIKAAHKNDLDSAGNVDFSKILSSIPLQGITKEFNDNTVIPDNVNLNDDEEIMNYICQLLGVKKHTPEETEIIMKLIKRSEKFKDNQEIKAGLKAK